jgi:hypothetical protein
MKKILSGSCLVAALGLSAMLLSGCVEAPPPGTAYASMAPPPAEVDVAVGVAPGPDYIWIGGHHVWRGDAYAWQAGTWGRRPHPNAVWVPGVWSHHRLGWYWRDGHWR